MAKKRSSTDWFRPGLLPIPEQITVVRRMRLLVGLWVWEQDEFL